MEVVYQKGSLLELITGKKVENKENVVIRYEKVQSKIIPYIESSTNAKSNEAVEDKTPLKSKKKPKNKKKIDNEPIINTTEDKEPLIEESWEEAEEEAVETKKGNRKEKKEKAKKFKQLKEEKEKLMNNPEEIARTVFVGNVPLTAKKIQFKKLFSKYGNVESVRFRCPPVKNLNTSKKVAVIKGEYHPERDSWTSYVKFKTAEEANKALEANGIMYKDHHLRVSICKSETKHDEDKAIFLGNLPLNVEDEELWKTFECCGKIESVRIVRDKATGIGKGFAFINFASSDAVQLALQMEDVKINKKLIRIQPSNIKAAKKNKQKTVAKVIKPRKPKNEDKSKRKRNEDHDMEEKSVKKFKKDSENGSKNENMKMTTNEYESFAGQKVEKKKKKKKDRGLLRKKHLANKLMSSTK